MTKTSYYHLFAFITTLLLVGCGGGSSSSTASSALNSPTSTTQCREIAPVLKTLQKTYVTSKDDYDTTRTLYKGSKGSFDDDKGSDDKGSDDKGSNDGGAHNEGKACLNCHSFTSAGTVFTSLNTPDNTPGALGYRIQLNDSIVYTNASYGVGNQITNAFPAGNYTAHVIDGNGNIVNSSAPMSHDATRRNCNSCHTATGNSGAPGRITTMKVATPTTVPTAPATTVCVSFNSNVMPILEARCKSCHGTNGRFSVTTTNATYAEITALQANGAQYMLDKAANTQAHAGGAIISPSSAEYTTIKAWITEGAMNN